PPASMLRSAASMASRMAASASSRSGWRLSSASQSGRSMTICIADSEVPHQAEMPGRLPRFVVNALDDVPAPVAAFIAQRAIARLAITQARAPGIPQPQAQADAEYGVGLPVVFVIVAVRAVPFVLVDASERDAGLGKQRHAFVEVPGGLQREAGGIRDVV